MLGPVSGTGAGPRSTAWALDRRRRGAAVRTWTVGWAGTRAPANRNTPTRTPTRTPTPTPGCTPAPNTDYCLVTTTSATLQWNAFNCYQGTSLSSCQSDVQCQNVPTMWNWDCNPASYECRCVNEIVHASNGRDDRYPNGVCVRGHNSWN